MAPLAKGRTGGAATTASVSSSALDHIRAFNVAVAEFRTVAQQHQQQLMATSCKPLAELEKIAPVLAKISEATVFQLDGQPEVEILFLNCCHLLELLDYKSGVVWDIVSLLTVASQSCYLSASQLEQRYQFLPILTRLLHSIPPTTHKRTLRLLQLIQVLVQDVEISRREAHLSVLITDLVAFASAEEKEAKWAAVTILALLARKNYLACKLIYSLYPEDLLRDLLTREHEDDKEEERLRLAIECLSFHIFNQISLCPEPPRLRSAQSLLSTMRSTLTTAYSTDNHLLMKFVRDFLQDIRSNAQWVGVLQEVDCVDMLSQILLIPDFSVSFNNTSSELFFSFLEEFALVFLKDNLAVFNLILKVVLFRLDAKPHNEVTAVLHLLNTCIQTLDIGGLCDADSRNLKFQVDQLLPCLQNVFLEGVKSTPTNTSSSRLTKNRGADESAAGSRAAATRQHIDCFAGCLQLLATLAQMATFRPQLSENIKASRMNAAFRQYYHHLAEVDSSQRSSRLAIEFLSLAAAMASGAAVEQVDASWQKILQECLEDRQLMVSVADVLRKESSEGALCRKAWGILALQRSPDTFFASADILRVTRGDTSVEVERANQSHMSSTQARKVEALLEAVTSSVSRLEVGEGEEAGLRVLSDVVHLHMYSRERERGQTDSLRQALEAADARIHAQNAALVEQEASLRAANRLLAQLVGKFSAAREEIADLRQQHNEASREADTTRNQLTDQLIVSRQENTKLEQDNARLSEKYAKSKAKTEQLTKDLEVYKQNEEQLQDRLRGEQRAREELSTVLAKKEEKLKRNVKQLEEDQAKRERLEKRVEELVKQNSSLETLSKGQEQALSKKEKQLQDAIEELAEMKRIQDAIFNLSKSRQTAGSCS